MYEIINKIKEKRKLKKDVGKIGNYNKMIIKPTY